MLFFKGLGAPLIQATIIPPPAPPAALVPGSCSADGQFILRAGPPAYWARRSASDVCTNSVSSGPTVRTDTGNLVPTPIRPGPMKMLKVGPFTVPYEASSFAIHWTTLMPSDWQDFINKQLAHDCSGCIFSSMRNTIPTNETTAEGAPYPDLRQWLGPGVPSQANSDFISGSMFSDSKVASLNDVIYGDVENQNPIVFVQHPDNGDDYGFYLWFDKQKPTAPWNKITNPYVMILVWRKIDRHWYSDAWNWITHIVAEVISVAGDVLCAVACTPEAVKAAMANPAATVGEMITVGLCSCPKPAAAPVVAPVAPAAPPWWEQWYFVLPVIAAVGLGLARLFPKNQSAKSAT